ncbi:MAG TPA: DEAD/DEAH box helicase [Syntrophorhabdales bacterium]|nr:DEAD/DEAH box helicase [Syntrophorhabdales bacterium]
MDTLRFQDLPLSKELQKAIDHMEFEEATPIQARAIPPILEGKDIVGQAQTGTGKTIAFGIPIIERIRPRNKHVQAIVLCPTRELAVQVSEELKRISRYKRDIQILPVYGGQPIERQIRALKGGVHVVIGTPGRTIDHINRGTLKLDNVAILVLDEADEMLNMGFIEDVETILETIPSERQTLLFSATMPKPILDLTNRYMRRPQLIKVVHKELTVPAVQQFYFDLREGMKPDVLSRLIDMYNLKLSLVFCNTKKKVDDVVMELQARGYQTEGLHGDMTQSQRDRVMEKFRRARIEILVATDVAARGIDVEGIEAVFNYDLPRDEEYYVHRIGRTARAGRAGYAFTFVVGREVHGLREIQRFANVKIARHPIPTLAEVEETRAVTLLESIKERIEEGELERYSSLIERLITEDYSALDIAAALLKMLLVTEGKEQSGAYGEIAEPQSSGGTLRLHLNVGRHHKVAPKDIVGAISGETGLPGKLIGKIDIHERHTFVEVPKEYAHEVLSMMKNRYIKGNKITIEQADRK